MSYIFISEGCHLFLFNGHKKLHVWEYKKESMKKVFFNEFAKVAESGPGSGQ